MLRALGSILVIGTVLTMLTGCGRTSYEWTTTIDNEGRRAVIWPSNARSDEAPVVVYFHGRGGDAADSESRRDFHTLWPEAIVVYAEGTNFDNRPNGARGWEIRFPHVYNACGNSKDFVYVSELLDHLESTWSVNSDRIFFAGHSSGGFFTLSLSELMSERLAAVAALGAYASFAPLPGSFDCNNTYSDGIAEGVSVNNLAVSANPVPTFFIFGDKENTIRNNSIVYSPDCGKWSYFQNSAYQIARKNSSVNPDCTASASFMSNYSTQIYEGVGPGSRPTRLYNDDHSWPNDANTWVIDYFKSWN